MLSRLGYHKKWIHWIKACLSPATISVLVNWCPTKEFKSKRGLIQGDPITPFLFIRMVKGLVGFVREASKKGLLKGVRVGSKSVEVKLLEFADDTLFFFQPQLQCAYVIKSVLRNFEIVSGLKVNFHKSDVSAIGLSEVDSMVFYKCLNTGHMVFPFQYLGITIGGNPKMVEF